MNGLVAPRGTPMPGTQVLVDEPSKTRKLTQAMRRYRGIARLILYCPVEPLSFRVPLRNEGING
jgi:hypothetical protein